MNLQGNKVLVVGMARSGISAAKLCRRLGAEVIIQDLKDNDDIRKLVVEFEQLGVNCLIGQNPDKIVLDQDYIILSPGVPTDLAFILKAEENGIKVLSEVELAYQCSKNAIIGITGTNGKTTTTSLVGQIVKAYRPNSEIVGNIGYPISDYVVDMPEDGYFVAELSSFQLEKIDTFNSHVSAVLNITPDHLNRHKTYENYIKAKENIFVNQTSEDFCILNYDDEICRGMSKRTKAKVVYFSRLKELDNGVCLRNDNIVIKDNDKDIIICNVDDLKILGNHSIENAMAAVAICYCVGIPIDIIIRELKAFEAVEHRIEFVDKVDEVRYFNDSKATNPDAAIKGLQAMKWPTVLIGGGMDKGSEFDDWFDCFGDKVKNLIVFGETAQKIIETSKRYGFNDVTRVANLEEAVKLAYSLADKGDCVLLSPACASWDMFSSFEERGNLFKELVMHLKE